MQQQIRRSARGLALTSLMLMGAAGAAQAQSSVTLNGLIDMSVGSFKSPGGLTIKRADSGNMSTSWWGVKGTEDLGGGLKASFALEAFMLNDTGTSGRFTGDGFFARSSFVGLSNELGSVNLGRNTTGLFISVLAFNALGDSFGFSPAIRHYFTSGTTTGDTGWNDSVKYVSPSLGGATVSAHIAAGEANGGRNTGLNVMYFGGPLGLTVAYQDVKKGAAVQDTKTWNLGGSYQVGPAKLYAQYGKVDNSNTKVNYKIAGLGASYAVVDTGSILFQWGDVKPSVGAKLSTTTVGYDYYLSKRTDVYAMYMNETRTSTSNGRSMAVGVRHRF